MGVVYHIGFNPSQLQHVAAELSGSTFVGLDQTKLASWEVNDIEAVLIGPAEQSNLSILQKVFIKDSLLPTILLVEPQDLFSTKQAVQFAPFISKYSYYYSLYPFPAEELENIMAQSRQRKTYAKIQSSVVLEMQAKRPVLQIQQLGTFLEQAPIGAVLLNKDFSITAMNKVAQSLFDITYDQDKKEPNLSDLFEKNEEQHIRYFLANAPSGERQTEVYTRHKFLQINVSEVINELGNSFLILLINDITERKVQENRLQTILNAMPQMGWMVDFKGAVTHLTEGWYTYTGMPKEETGENWLEYIYKDDQESVQREWQQNMTKGLFFEIEARYKKYDGQYRWHLIRTVPIYNSKKEIDYWLGIATDIDQQKKVEKDLEDQVTARTTELSNANNDLIKSNSDLKDFAHITSHDLQEPLRKVKIFSERLRDNINDHEKVFNYLSKIDGAVIRMTDLITGILSYSNLSKEDNKLIVIDLNEILKASQFEFEVLLEDKGGEIHQSDLPKIKGNALQIQQLFNNLISNSLKYSKAAPRINVTSSIVNSDTSFFKEIPSGHNFNEIIFADNGIGFDEKYADRIFAIFSRLHDRSEYSGTGIGLALCKKIVDNHNGYITVSSELNKGTRFYIYLPVIA
ncbi:sensor histidine kinase [Flavobacterium sp. N1736]|uniref:sensor histidine kinase n=1 Tax=Flavobacterium sp. N1736 TaxID=2986823 RepID=UPI002224FBFD|nr:ATP-binding protein [Flavobacterium sp. N1736]